MIRLSWVFLFWMGLPIFITQSVFAQGVSVALREQVGTLPRGRFLVSLLNFQTSLGQQYQASGALGRVGEAMNQSVSFLDVASESGAQNAQLQGLFISNGVGLNQTAGRIEGAIEGSISGQVPVLGYGVTDDLGLYVAMPLIRFQFYRSARFVKSEQSEVFLDQLVQGDQSAIAQEFELAFQNSLENKLFRTQYSTLADLNRVYLGDMQLSILKLMATSASGGWGWFVQPTLTLPTASRVNLEDLYGLRAGDRRWGVGAKMGTEYRFGSSGFSFNSSLSASVLMPTTQSRRIPIKQSDQLFEGLDESTQISGGERFQLNAQGRYETTFGLGSVLGFQFQRRFADRFQGNLYEQSLYDAAATRTTFSLGTAYASVDFSTLPLFLAQKFIFPAVFELGVGQPLFGQNAMAETVGQFQVTMFF